MEEGRASRTAEAMAAIRAVETLRPADTRVTDDPYARWFVGRGLGSVVDLARSTTIADVLVRIYDVAYPGLVGYVICRHRQIDDWLLTRAAGTTEQIVLVGAGYDSRFKRFEGRLGDQALFEADHPSTQARKQQILREHQGGPLEHVTYVALDLGEPRPLEALLDAGFESGKRTTFVIEGVFFYLEQRDVETTLRFVREHAAPGSLVIFDNMYRTMVDGTCELHGARRIRRAVERRGEPLRFGLDQGEVEGFVEPFGMRVIEDLGGDELRARFLGDRRMKIYPFTRLTLAELVDGRSP